MADPRDPRLVSQVTRLMQDTRTLRGPFFENQNSEAHRGLLKTRYQEEGTSIKNSLATLISQTPRLKPALDRPNAAYNQFISIWNNGAGDLQRSYVQIDQFWRWLQDAQAQLDVLMVPPGPVQPGRRPPGTPKEQQVFRTLRTKINELYPVYEGYMTYKTPPTAPTTIREDVNLIGQQLNSSSLSQQAQMLLADSKAEWGQFTSLYKNGNGIADWNCLSRLAEFKTRVNLACIKFLGS